MLQLEKDGAAGSSIVIVHVNSSENGRCVIGDSGVVIWSTVGSSMPTDCGFRHWEFWG